MLYIEIMKSIVEYLRESAGTILASLGCTSFVLALKSHDGTIQAVMLILTAILAIASASLKYIRRKKYDERYISEIEAEKATRKEDENKVSQDLKSDEMKAEYNTIHRNDCENFLHNLYRVIDLFNFFPIVPKELCHSTRFIKMKNIVKYFVTFGIVFTGLSIFAIYEITINIHTLQATNWILVFLLGCLVSGFIVFTSIYLIKLVKAIIAGIVLPELLKKGKFLSGFLGCDIIEDVLEKISEKKRGILIKFVFTTRNKKQFKKNCTVYEDFALMDYKLEYTAELLVIKTFRMFQFLLPIFSPIPTHYFKYKKWLDHEENFLRWTKEEYEKKKRVYNMIERIELHCDVEL